MIQTYIFKKDRLNIMEKYIHILKNTSMFQGISEEEILPMLQCLSVRIKNYSKGEYLLRSGEKVQTIGMVLSGQALIINEDVWGNRNLITELTSGMLYGESYACISDVPAEISVIANEDTTIMIFNINHIITTCSSACGFHTRLIHNLLAVIAERNVKLMKKIDHVSKKTLREKVLNYLSSESMHFNSNTFAIPYDRQGLADYLNVDRSALSNELSKLQKEGILSYKKNTFTLNY